LWQAFNLNAEGWGINGSLFATVLETLQLPDSLAKSDALFKTLDTDENNIVDGLEALTTLAMVSSMTPLEVSAPHDSSSLV